MLPAVIYLLSITLFPGVYVVYQSFYDVYFGQWTPVQWDQYERLWSDRVFWEALWNTILIGGTSLAVQTFLALLLAFFAYRDPLVRGWRILFLLPMLFMPSAVAYLWKLAFTDAQVISDLLMRVGFISERLDFTNDSFLARMTLVVADVWQWTPFLFIIFVAGLQAQGQEVEEAARLDGASWPSIFWNISLPLMRPVIAIAVILRAIDIIALFTTTNIITRGGPGNDTVTISFFIYKQAFTNTDPGYASAAAAVMLFTLVIVSQLLLKRFFRSDRA